MRFIISEYGLGIVYAVLGLMIIGAFSIVLYICSI